MIVRYVTEEIGISFARMRGSSVPVAGRESMIMCREDDMAFVERVSKKAIVLFPGIELFADYACC